MNAREYIILDTVCEKINGHNCVNHIAVDIAVYYLHTCPRACAISNVPTVSMLEAMTGIPLYFCFEFLNINSR